jgi:hypothetical protein
MFARKLEEPDVSMSVPGAIAPKPLNLNGFLFGRTLIASDNIARHHSDLGEMSMPLSRTRPVLSDTGDVMQPASLEERIAALEGK